MPSRRRIPENTSEYARWLADRIESRDRGISLSPTTSMFVGMALRGYAELLDGHEALKLHFIVTVIDDRDQREIVCGSASIAVAWAAFQAAIPDRPKAKQIILHQGARVLGKHPIFSDIPISKDGDG